MAVIIDLLGGSVNLTLGTDFAQNACSYRLTFTDATTTNNNNYPNWKVSYYLITNGAETLLGTTDKGGSVSYDFCASGVYNIKQVCTIYDADCVTVLYSEDGTFQADVDEVFPILDLPSVNCCYEINTPIEIAPSNIAINNNQCVTTPTNDLGFFRESPITLVKYLDQTPIVQNGIYVRFFSTGLNITVGDKVRFQNMGLALADYETLEEYTVTAVADGWFEIESVYIPGTPDPGAYILLTTTGGFAGTFGSISSTEQILRYTLYYYDLRTGTWIQEGNSTLFGVVSTTGSDYTYSFTPTKLTRYKLQAAITNCCQTLTKEVEFAVCDAITVEHSCKGLIECSTCNTYTFSNYTDFDIEVTVKDLILDKDIHVFTINANSVADHSFTEDSVYSFTYTNPDSQETKVIVIANNCDIDKCYTDLLKLQLCNTVSTTDCCDDSFLESRLANIQALYQTYLHKIEEFTDLNLRFTQIDITNRLDDFQKIGKIRDQLLTFCKKCRRHCNGCFDLKSCI